MNSFKGQRIRKIKDELSLKIIYCWPSAENETKKWLIYWSNDTLMSMWSTAHKWIKKRPWQERPSNVQCAVDLTVKPSLVLLREVHGRVPKLVVRLPQCDQMLKQWRKSRFHLQKLFFRVDRVELAPGFAEQVAQSVQGLRIRPHLVQVQHWWVLALERFYVLLVSYQP